MQRNRGQKALYEVISQSKHRAGKSNKLEPLHGETYAGVLSKKSGIKKESRQRWDRPRPIQVFDRRIEISVTFPVAAIIAAGCVLTLILVYKAGQYSAPRTESVPGARLSPETLPDDGQDVITGYNTERPALAHKRPGNAVVIQAYPLRAHLEPVRLFFENHGINTEILKDGDIYLLVTTERFEENPNRPGTQGYMLKQRIIELGPSYKAAPGRETFAPNYFRDAYARRFASE
jgi:hypothetical protein